MDSMESDNIEYMEIDDTDSVSGEPARQVPPQTPMESGMELPNNIINVDTIPKESRKRALEIKKSDRKKLREQLYEREKSLFLDFKEWYFLQDQLIINAKETEQIEGTMQADCLEDWNSFRENFHVVSNKFLPNVFKEGCFVQDQRNRNAEEIEPMEGIMQADFLEDWKGFQETYH